MIMVKLLWRSQHENYDATYTYKNYIYILMVGYN